jgi:hypothetical protein
LFKGQRQSVHSHHASSLLLICIEAQGVSTPCGSRYWQASQVGSSTPQNFTSVAGVLAICARAAAAAISMALKPVVPPDETALCEPD